MSILEDLTTDTDVNEESDRLGGFQPLESNLYPLTIKQAFISIAASEAAALEVHFNTDDGKELRQKFWMRSGKAKGCKNYYVNQKGDKFFLPGFNMANAICLLTVGKEISKMVTEPKVINLYDPAQGKETATKVDMLTELIGKKVVGGVIKQVTDKKKKNENTGEYEATGETRMENEVDKIFRERDHLTVAEIRARQTDPVFISQWKEKWAGETRDKTDKEGAKAGPPKAKREAGKQAPQTSIFE